jgi:DNA processing protein
VLERNVTVLLENRPGYPCLLRHLYDPPPMLFTRGDRGLFERVAVAVVGSRRNTEYGAAAARMVAAGLAAEGVVVVSGLARGIDGIAHASALEANGPTLGVIGSGIDVFYPRENARLQERVAEHGLLVSEFLPGASAAPHHFPKRNRIIAALSRAVVVVEAAAGSGSLITVEHALELGREVLAVPGALGRPTSAGVNALLQDGAGLVTRVEDVLEVIGRVRFDCPSDDPTANDPGGERAPVEPGPRGDVLAALGADGAHVDGIASSCGLPASSVLVALLELELEGRVRQLPGMRFARPGV